MAHAVQSQLHRDATCTPWDQGVFGLSEPIMQSLTSFMEGSDFGIFILSADDFTESRGLKCGSPRDNVIFELGLFSGRLGTDRCFFLIPEGESIKLPSDLAGIVPAEYNPRPRGGNFEASVGPACNRIRVRIKDLGIFHSTRHTKLSCMIVEYECCEWIKDFGGEVNPERWQRKAEVFKEMKAFCLDHAINKRLLLSEHRSGAYMALFAAIASDPEPLDADYILNTRQRLVIRGNAQQNALEAICTLFAYAKANNADRVRLIKWARELPDATAETLQTIRRLEHLLDT